VAMIFVVLLGTITGLLAAKYASRPPDRIISGFYIFGVASPPFFLPLVLIIVFALFLPILPTGGQIDLLVKLPLVITGIPIIDALFEGNWTAFSSLLTHIVLPSLSLALGAFGILTRILRSNTLQQLDSNYIRAARARGVPENKISFKYAFKNSLISVITLISLLAIFLISGDIFVENIFAYPGMGQYAVQAALTLDYPAILGTTLVYGIIIVLLNLAADLLYAVVDPRIRYS